jgi:PPM family protein phosphatase
MGPVHGIRLRSSARSHMGQVRDNNEDYIHLWTQENVVLAIVADGMGGAAAGEEASRIAVDTIQRRFVMDAPPNDLAQMDQEVLTEKLVDVIRQANVNIVERAMLYPELKGMGTTVTLAVVRGSQVIVAHVGDSRAYHISGDNHDITQITSDHSFVEALLAAGHITREQAEDHPMRNVLYRALGQAEEVDVDIYYNRLRVGDRLVLCSDGLTRHVKPQEIAEMSLANQSPDYTSQRLIDLANQRGGEDNVSVIVINVEGDAPAQRRRVEDEEFTDEATVLIRPAKGTLKIDFSGMDEEDKLSERKFRDTLDGDPRAALMSRPRLPKQPVVLNNTARTDLLLQRAPVSAMTTGFAARGARLMDDAGGEDPDPFTHDHSSR